MFFRTAYALWIAVILLTISIIQQAHASDELDIGQTKLRSDWQQERAIETDLQDFLDRRWLIGPDENFWIEVINKSEELPQPERVESSIRLIVHDLSTQVFRLTKIGKELAHLFDLIGDRPIETCLALFSIFRFFLFVLMLTALSLSLFHLHHWIPAIKQDLTNRFGIRSRRSIIAIGVFSLILALISHQILLLSFLVSLVGLAYSYRKKFFQFFSVAFAFSLIFGSFFNILQDQMNSHLASESLNEGRNQLSFSETQLSGLSDWEKSVWAQLNQSDALRLIWLDRAQPSLEKQILQLNLKSNPVDPSSSIQAYEKLHKEYPQNETISYNLYQLYTQEQDLISAEDVRNKISVERLKDLSEKSSRLRIKLLPPERENLFLEALLHSGLSYLKSFKSENMKNWNLRKILYDLFIIILLILSFSFQKRVSGICRMTGEATSSCETPYSRLAELFLAKSNELDASMRRRFQRAQKRAAQFSSDRIKLWALVLPTSYEASEQKTALAFFVCFVIYLLIFSGIKTEWLNIIYSQLGFQTQLSLAVWSSSPLIFALGLAAYLVKAWHSRKRAT